jgi:soluble lytic murein transglycosylase-like protein
MADRRSVAATLAVLALAGCGGPGASTPGGAGATGREPVGQAGGDASSPTAGPATPSSAARIADRLRRLHQAISDRRTPHTALRRTAEQQQIVLRILGLHPGLERRVVSRLPVRLREDTVATIRAGHLLRSMYPSRPGALSHRLPAWRIERPQPAGDLLSAYRAAQRRYGVTWTYLAAINMVESDFGRVHGLSSAGARGPMQFMPATWRAYGAGGDVDDPRDAVLGAARLLAANGFARAPLQALRHYNDSAAYARAVTLLAGVVRRDPRQFFGFYHWRVFYLTSRGSILLPVGYDERRGVPVSSWLDQHPHALVLR